jgi:hypothetical protein
VLLIMMMMAVYSHYMVNDKFERIAPALVREYIRVYYVCNMGVHDLYKESLLFNNLRVHNFRVKPSNNENFSTAAILFLLFTHSF